MIDNMERMPDINLEKVCDIFNYPKSEKLLNIDINFYVFNQNTAIPYQIYRTSNFDENLESI